MGTDYSTTINALKIVAGVLGAIAAILIAVKRYRAKTRKARASSGKGPKTKTVSRAEIKKWYRGAIDKIVTARLQGECCTTSGEPVFLSHYISNGRFRHWVLHVHSHKYELRQRMTDDTEPQSCYTAAIAESGFDIHQYQQSVTVHHSPEVGNYFYSVIGWTTLSKEEVDQKCDEVSTSFGKYSLFKNNCHDFLQSLADKIVTTKAPDWDWFRHHVAGPYEYIEQPPLGYNIICASTWSKHLARTKHYLSTAECKEINSFIVVLEDFVEAHLAQVNLSLIASLNNTNQLDASNPVDASGGGHHHAHDYGGGAGA